MQARRLAANATARASPPPMPPLTASPSAEPRAIPGSWTGFDVVPDPDAVEALDTYKKKDPAKGARTPIREEQDGLES